MKIVTVNGQSYLGNLEKTDEEVKVTEAFALPDPYVHAGTVADYMEAKEMGKLTLVSFGGAGVSYSENDLDEEVQLEFKTQELQMEQALKTAPKKLVVQEFRNRLGKR